MTSAKAILATLAVLVSSPCFGQANNPIPKGKRTKLDDPGVAVSSDDSNSTPVPKSERQRNTELPQISVIDKLLSIESALGGKLHRSTEEQWAKDYNQLYQKFRMDGNPAKIRGAGKNTACAAMALGVKASDGVMALKARNIEALKDAADQIEVLAKKLGATQGELGMANTVKIYANKSQWFNAFLALGRLQRDVLNYLRSNPEKTDLAVLVIVGGWMQGGRCVTHVIDENYDETVSNILREQRLVKLITENMEKLAPVYLNDPLVAEVIKALPDIYKNVDVGFTEPVKQDVVKELHKTFDGFVVKIMSADGK
jgi:hypothetical protein